MAKKIEQTPDEAILYRDLQKLVKRANQRLLRIERETGEKGTFTAKQLYDYLDSSNIKAVTKEGRISLKKSYNITQMQGIKKATEQFLENKVSTVRGLKKFKKIESERAGKDLDYYQLDTIYQARHNWKWVLNYMTESDFFTFVKVAKESGWSVTKWVDELSRYIDEVKDEDLIFRLTELYNYFVEG